ncbi:hypothetical protein VTJ49DRAFT_4281 [Mycothermus thermophilus]|uniref:Uncharacterized protein n=1 Tax=Humicola insolens TaxID=85995 RepID=A0ABR3V6L7_HUMIN
MRRHRAALLGWLCASSIGVHGQSTVSVYLPEYGDSDWAALRGSVLSSDASTTVYTVFCADCQIAADLPFVFTEGPSTLVYKGENPGTLTADLECRLEGTTAATCTGSSSFGSGYRGPSITGPTETVWTSTFTGSDVTWGVLTLSTPPPATSTLDLEGTVVSSQTGEPVPTSGADGRLRGGLMASIGAVVLGLLLRRAVVTCRAHLMPTWFATFRRQSFGV